MNNKKIFFILLIINSLFATFLGAFMVVFGEMDDSPGAQFLGLLSVIFGIAGLIIGIKKTKK